MKRFTLILSALLLAACVQQPPHKLGITYSNLAAEFQPCSIQGKGPGCITPSQMQDLINFTNGRTPVSIVDYGGDPTGTADSSTALTAAAATGKPIYCPSGATFKVSVSFTLNNIIFGDSTCTIRWSTDLGSGNVGLIFDNPSGTLPIGYETISGLILLSPAMSGPNQWSSGCSLVLGTGPSCSGSAIGMNGFQIGGTAATAPQPITSNMDIEGFHEGVVWNTNYGHLSLRDSFVRNNDYDLYILQNAGDTVLIHDFLVGAGMAAIGCDPGSNCLNGGCYVESTHMGFTPFGIFMPPSSSAAASTWIQDCLFDQTRWESIGNAAIRGEAIGSGALATWPALDSTIIRHPGFSWNASYELTANSNFSGTENSTTTISGNASSCIVGQRVTGTNVPNHSFVVSASSSQLVMTRAATGSGAETITCIWDQLYAIESPDVKGNVRIDQGTYPFTPGSTGALVYTINGDVGSWRLYYEDPNFGPPDSANNLLVDDNAGTDLYNAYITWASQGIVDDCTVSDSSTSCTSTVPWQYYAMHVDSLWAIQGLSLVAGATPATGLSLSYTVSGANVTFTATMASACTKSGGCEVNWTFPGAAN